MAVLTQSCPTLHDPVDCSLPGSSVHGVLQARVLEWFAISFSRRSSQPRDRTQVSRIAGRCFTIWATREAQWAIRIFWKLSPCQLNSLQISSPSHRLSFLWFLCYAKACKLIRFHLFVYYLFIWLCWVFAAACRIFSCGMQTLSCSMWDLFCVCLVTQSCLTLWPHGPHGL